MAVKDGLLLVSLCVLCYVCTCIIALHVQWYIKLHTFTCEFKLITMPLKASIPLPKNCVVLTTSVVISIESGMC